MEQDSINQRIKILIEKLGFSARAFSEIIGESPTNVHNYTGKRNSMPGADFLEKVLSHFENVNPMWLISGKGELFTDGSSSPIINLNPEKNKGTVIGINNGTATQNSYTLSDCERERDSLRADRDSLAKQVELLHSQLQTKDALIAAKDEMLDLLRGGFNRPN